MQKRLVLLFIALLFILALVPAYYAPDDEALRQSSSLCDICSQPFTATGTFHDLNPARNWTGISLPWVVAYRLPLDLPSSGGTRAPPA